MTESILKSPGLFSVFCLLHLSSDIQLFQFLYQFFGDCNQTHQLELVSPSLSCSIVFFVLKQGLRIYLNVPFSFNVTVWSARMAKSTIRQVPFFFWLSLDLVVSLRSGNLFGSKDPVIIIIIILLVKFLHQCYLMVFHWSPSDSKFLEVFRTLLTVLADLNAVVWFGFGCLMAYQPS